MKGSSFQSQMTHTNNDTLRTKAPDLGIWVNFTPAMGGATIKRENKVISEKFLRALLFEHTAPSSNKEIRSNSPKISI